MTFDELVTNQQYDDAIILAKNQSVEYLQKVAYLCDRLGYQNQAIKFAKLSMEVIQNSSLIGNLSYYLGRGGFLSESLNCINQSIQLDEQPCIEHYCQKALILTKLHQLQDAIHYYQEVLKINPEYHFARFHLGCTLVQSGNLKEGFPLLESRFDFDQELVKFRKRFSKPNWDGKTKGKLLIFNEQGCGDAIMYARYLPQDMYLIGEFQEELVGLFDEKFDVVLGRKYDYNIFSKTNFPEHDFVCSFSSLPTLLDPEFEIPTVPYLDVKSGTTLEKYKFNIGLCYSGSPFNPINDQRSITPGLLIGALKGMENVRLWSLQKDDQVSGLSCLAGKDLLSTAQGILGLDLVITVDSAVAHLAGAMGKDCWLLLSQDTDHRWGLVSETTPWYRSMRLFRQDKLGNWEGVVNQVKEELSKLDLG